MKTLKELLIEFDDYIEAREWAGDKTIEEVVKECHRGDWLLYLAEKIELHERKIIACAGHCANTVRHLMKDERSTKLVDLCMNFEDESISFEELDAARDAARATTRADAAYAAANYAARAAARARVGAAHAAASAAAYAAVYSAVYSAADAYDIYLAARKENELQTANIVRERLGQDIINKVNLLLNN